jgi:hypothetical protein
MSSTDGMVIGTTQIVNNGPPQNRYNIVLVAEGYQQSELGKFATDAQQYVERLFATQPFDALECAINVYRVDVASTDSGADDPLTCADGNPGSGATPATYFDATFCTNGIRRRLTVNDMTVMDVVNVQVPQSSQILVIVNSSIYGGAGGQIATTSVSGDWQEIAIHEFGHSGFNLADEYNYYRGCDVDEPNQYKYMGIEPSEPNVTIDTNRSTIKWGDLILSSTSLPTTSNQDCTQCDPQPSPVPVGTVGAFEGARYFHCGIYRPEFNCKMRVLSLPFCAVCQRRIRQTLTPFGCFAPVFKGASRRVCACRNPLNATAAILVLGLAILSRACGEATYDRLFCIYKQLLFRINHCQEGNSDSTLCVSRSPVPPGPG